MYVYGESDLIHLILSCKHLHLPPRHSAPTMLRCAVILFALLGIATAQTLNQSCDINGPDQCADGSYCGFGLCGGFLSPCTVGTQCVSGSCNNDPNAGRLYQSCNAKFAVGDSGCGPSDNLNCRGLACNSTGICGGDGIMLSGSCPDGKSACVLLNCVSQLFVNNVCTAQHSTKIGESCDLNQQCPVGIDCTSGICGGPNYCVPDDATVSDGNGPSSRCSNGDTCINFACAQPLAVGDSCTNTLQCGAGAECTNGECGGDGSACTPSRFYTPGGIDGPSAQCSSNYCSDSICGDDPISVRCSSAAQCDGNKGCGTDSICGGEGAACAPDAYSPDWSGYSTLCQPARSCYNGACRFDGSLGVGASCSATELCSPNLHCIDGTCKDELPPNTGSYCSDDSGCTGATTCVDSECVLTTPPPGQSDKPITRRDQLVWTQLRCPRSGEIACPVANGGRDAYEVGSRIAQG